MLNIVIFGPPGSGKGTQSLKIAEKYNLIHISTGDIFREELANNTTLGQQARGYMDAGNLVPDELVIAMLESKVDKSLALEPAGFIFDGFPRTIMQAEALEKMLQRKNSFIKGVLALEVEDAELIKRIMGRGKDSGRADDVDEKIIKNRIKVYKSETAPVAGFYEMYGKLKIIRGKGSVEDIFKQLCESIDEYQQ